MQTERPKIIHFIDTLSVGGAETLLKNTVSILPEFRHVIIYLNEPHTIKSQVLEKNVEFICLDYKGWTHLPAVLLKLKKIIRKAKPVLVHSHLFYSTLLARLSVPKEIPLISTLHSMYSVDAFEKNRFSIWAERMTLKERHHLVGVSKYVLDDYLRYIAFQGKKFVLYNFLPDAFFENKSQKFSSNPIKCVAVGNLKEAKNKRCAKSQSSINIFAVNPQREKPFFIKYKKSQNTQNKCTDVQSINPAFPAYAQLDNE